MHQCRIAEDLPFVSLPEGKWFPNQKFTFDNALFVSQIILDLKCSGCVKKVDKQPVVCSPSLVVTNIRLVINLSFVEG